MGVFATALNCMDGRVQEPVMEYVRKSCRVAFVDMVTCPAPVSILAGGMYPDLVEYLYEAAKISVCRHQSQVIAVIAHHDCAANPVSRGEQIGQLKSALERIDSWRFDCKLLGLWVGSTWTAELVSGHEYVPGGEEVREYGCVLENR